MPGGPQKVALAAKCPPAESADSGGPHPPPILPHGAGIAIEDGEASIRAHRQLRWDGVRLDRRPGILFQKTAKAADHADPEQNAHSRRPEKTTTAEPVGAVRFLADEAS